MKYKKLTLDEERALFSVSDSLIINCTFDGKADGESALKEAHDITVQNSYFNLRYPLWHVTNAKISNCDFTENCRAPLWYDKNITIQNCSLKGIKALRECKNIVLKDSSVNSTEFIWKCRNIKIENVAIDQTEYPFFEISDGEIKSLKLKGKYSFQYCTNLEISDSELDTKDAFWHTKNVTVKNSVIRGEYLGWYSENLTLINCRIEGTQPLCYCKNLVLENCIMENCDLSFERSSVQAKVIGKIDSIKQPYEGTVLADCIGQIIPEDSPPSDSTTAD